MQPTMQRVANRRDKELVVQQWSKEVLFEGVTVKGRMGGVRKETS